MLALRNYIGDDLVLNTVVNSSQVEPERMCKALYDKASIQERWGSNSGLCVRG